MAQYLMSVWNVKGEPTPSPDEMEPGYQTVEELNLELKAAGAWVFGEGLHDPDTATVVRAQEGEVLTTDGPFVEAKEYLGGFWIIEAPDREAALKWAAKATAACRGPVEVRPFHEAQGS